METSQDILVIILASALALFLVLAIVALVKLIQILNTLKRITDKAEKIAHKAESIGELFTKTAAPVAIGRLLSHLAHTVFNKSGRKRGGRS